MREREQDIVRIIETLDRGDHRFFISPDGKIMWIEITGYWSANENHNQLVRKHKMPDGTKGGVCDVVHGPSNTHEINYSTGSKTISESTRAEFEEALKTAEMKII